MARNVKAEDYGPHRLLDGEGGVANAFVRRFLDRGVRLRWYLVRPGPNGVGRSGGRLRPPRRLRRRTAQNLGGRVVYRGRATFENNLRTNLEDKVFSFVMVDGDRTDYVAAVKRAARENRFCGMFFMQEPDFEFANFPLPSWRR
jgi:hypothetical protein